MRSFLRWAGSKCQLLPVLREYWRPCFQTYIEPFAGSATLFFALEPRRAILGDRNSELIEALGIVQTDVIRLLEALRRIKRGRDAYYRLRRRDPQDLTPVERAARFIYLNRYCFNGLFRTNEQGKFNVPYGRQRKRVRIDETLLAEGGHRLQSALLISGDFEVTISHAGKNDFVYLDPPYVGHEDDAFVEYGPGSFSTKDLERFETALERLDSAGAKFLVSYADSPIARKTFSGWRARRIWARRNIAGFAQKRRGVHELLVSNF